LCFDKWKNFKDINPDDRVAVIRRMEEPIETKNESPLRIALLAHLIGDGSYLKGQPLRYTTASEENNQIVKDAAEKEFGVKVNRHEGRGNWHQLVFSGDGNRWHPKGLNLWLKQIGVFNQRSYEKKVPEFIFTLSTPDVCLFIKHLWATDGTIYTRNPNNKGASRIAFSTNSKRLASDVAALLLRIGIISRIRVTQQGKYRPMYSVDVTGNDNQLQFLNKVGAFGPKIKQAEELLLVLSKKDSNTNVDTIPNDVFLKVKDAMRKKGVSHRKMALLRGTSYGGNAHFSFAPSREVLMEYGTLLEDDELKTISQSDIFWDKVISVNSCGEEEVFDLTVNDTHNWLANGGIVTHNSGAIEQDADMVMFLYRPEYYDITANEMGESNKGETHIKIAKHRNGSLDTIKLKALLHIQKFVEDDGSGMAGLGLPPGAWKPVPDSGAGGDDAKLYIQTGSKMNDLPFSEEEETPF
jgi:replicative DNA helicase